MYTMNPQLYHAASSGDLSFFERLTNFDTLLHVTTKKNTVLHVAVQCGHLQVAEKIVQLRSSLMYQTNSKGDTPLHVAARVEDPSMVRLLINTKRLEVETGGGQILSMVNLAMDTALHVAVRYGNSEAMKELINEDPELAMSINNAGESALFLAVDRKLYEIASHILSAAPKCCSFVGRDGMNVLHAIVLCT